jgi:hypothetical protein
MKPCICEGTNERCQYCDGKGYVEEGTGLPRRRSDRGEWMPKIEPATPPVEAPPPGRTIGCLWTVLLLLLLFLVLRFLLNKF